MVFSPIYVSYAGNFFPIPRHLLLHTMLFLSCHSILNSILLMNVGIPVSSFVVDSYCIVV